MRYVRVPAAVQMLDPGTDQPLPQSVTWAEGMRSLFLDQRWQQQIDVLDLIELRQKLVAAKTGDVVELPDEQWTTLVGIVKRPQSLSPVFVYSAAPFFRALLDATASKPEAPDADRS